ncbi:hypothetical protein NDU88_001718 [Pleurodeles waltl]|uniref:Uncharacterized protein n=1 Tax=Pleurodeles waltl TaxID=8319 RepID=A0AAV7U8E5_PLEWA|nr:hypothetical protein NDU88_001718 [Pleurodeles waltl]
MFLLHLLKDVAQGIYGGPAAEGGAIMALAEEKVQVAMRLLAEAGRMDPARRASIGVAAAMIACSPP